MALWVKNLNLKSYTVSAQVLLAYRSPYCQCTVDSTQGYCTLYSVKPSNASYNYQESISVHRSYGSSSTLPVHASDRQSPRPVSFFSYSLTRVP